MNYFKRYTGFCVMIVMSLLATVSNAQEREKLINLQGDWKFTISPSGNWNASSYNDSDWDEIFVPSAWENEGYHGFNGFGYYRKSFVVPAGTRDLDLFLYLGYIDDADEVFLNGEKIGSSGAFPPNYFTAYNTYRKYRIPKGLIKIGGKNTIAVKVYDVGGGGGIVGGDVGIYGERNPMDIAVDLAGEWKFKPGDNLDYKLASYDDSNWDKIMAPSTWEEQGYSRLDGFAWYRKEVYFPADLEGKMIVLMLGYIDDLDQTYLNGKKVGQIGEFSNYSARMWTSNDWRELRAYFIPPENFKAGQKNTIAIRVFDSGQGGGIYKGRLAIIEKDKYVSYWRNKKHR